MMRMGLLALVFGLLAIVMPVASAFGYGTSSISVSNSLIGVNAGSSAYVGYTVNLASGSTWGTTLVIENQAALSSNGITVSASNPSGDPPFSGTLNISTSLSTPAGSYSVTLAATGDDPSTNNTVITVNVANLRGPVTQGANSTAPSTLPTTSVSQAQSNASTGSLGQQGGQAPQGNGTLTALSVLLLLIIVIGAYLLWVMASMSAKLIILGVVLILIGTVVWLYGDYSGGILTYIWGGVAAIVVGTAIWLYGDYLGGEFAARKR